MKERLKKFIPRFILDQFTDSPNRVSIAVNAGWLFVERILRMSLGLFVGIWVARYLGPDQFGSYNFAIALVALFIPIASLGIHQIAVRDLVQEPDQANEILGGAFFLRLLGGLIGFALAVAAVSIVRPDDGLSRWLVIIIATALIFRSFETGEYWFQSKVQSKYVVYAKSIASVLSALLKITLILAGAGLILFAVAYVSEFFLGAVCLLAVLSWRGRPITTWSFDKKRVVSIFRDTLPLALSGLLYMFYLRVDQVMLGQMLGDWHVGIYSTAVRIAEVWYFIPYALVNSSFPAILESKENSEELYRRRLQKLYNFLLWFSILFAIPISIFSGDIIGALYGVNYIDAAPILSINIWSGVFVFFGVARVTWMVTEGLQKYNNYFLGAGVLLNVFLNLLLIPWMGGIGAALASLAAQVVANYIAPLFFRPTRTSSIMFNRALFALVRKEAGSDS
jgi:PST family polysaccharide transporter